MTHPHPHRPGRGFRLRAAVTLAAVVALSAADVAAAVAAPIASSRMSAVAMPAGVVTTLAVGSNPPVDPLYLTPGTRTVNGRDWRTRCEPYGSSATRCFTEIRATQVARTSRGYVTTTGWVFNNLTYRDVDGVSWKSNVLATPGERTSGGRRWKVVCSELAGWRRCTSHIWATVISRQAAPSGGYTYRTYGTWQFNNVVWLSRAGQPGPGPGTTTDPGTLEPPPPSDESETPINVPNPGDSVNCSDFATWGDANRWYEQHYAYFGDVANLDSDGNGIPCESLPGAP